MTIEDENNYQNSHDCWICNEKLDKDKVRDNCHITGKCNLKLKIPKKISYYFS